MSDTDPTPPPAEPPPAAITQEQIDKIASRARSEGKSTALKEVLADLGVDDVDAVKTALADHQARLAADKTEVDRAKDEAEEAKREAEKARMEASELRLSMRVEAALIDAQVDAKARSRVAEMIKLDPSATDEDITSAIEALKEDIPQLFAEPDGAPGTPSWAPKGGTGDQKPPAAKAGLEAGADLYAKMYPVDSAD